MQAINSKQLVGTDYAMCLCYSPSSFLLFPSSFPCLFLRPVKSTLFHSIQFSSSSLVILALLLSSSYTILSCIRYKSRVSVILVQKFNHMQIILMCTNVHAGTYNAHTVHEGSVSNPIRRYSKSITRHQSVHDQ